MTELKDGLAIRLKGHTALVTGGSRGIGRSCSLLLGSCGAAVAVLYHQQERKAAEVVDQIRAGGGEALAIGADLSDESQVSEAITRTVDALGQPTILVNNAGIWKGGPIECISPSDWDQTLAVNLRSMYLCTRALVPEMKKARSGRIVNIASTAGQRGEALHSHYAASKGAVIAFTRSLAVELAPFTIRVNCVAPGWVDTEMNITPFSRDGRERIEKTIPLGRVGHAEEIASVVAFAASDLASFMTGSVFSVNGGAVMA